MSLTWNDVSRWCYPGSTVDVPCLPLGKVQNAGYVVSYTVEDGETYLTLHNGFIINARDYYAPLGWTPPQLDPIKTDPEEK